MKNKWIIAFITVFVIALAFRLPGLSFRTMHGDEAVNALKFAHLLEENSYQYDPQEYHGPTLYYLTLPIAFISSSYSLHDLNEVILRSLSVLFGLALLILLFLQRERLGSTTIIVSSMLMAISPIFVFYSRYYIHEMLFVFFIYAAIFAGLRLYYKPSTGWSALLGILSAFAMATKETWIIVFLSASLALISMLLIYPQFRQRFYRRYKKLSLPVYLSFIIAFAVAYCLLFSSFLQNVPGIADSFISITGYWDKAHGDNLHIHPWYQYFKWLFFWGSDGYVWSEAFIAFLALAGFYYCFQNRSQKSYKPLFIIRFIAIFSFITIIIFSAILYKTPWNALTFMMGIILLAGYGSYRIFLAINSPVVKKTIAILAAVFVIQLSWQSYRLNFIAFEDPVNPYVYAQPKKDILDILAPLHVLAENHPDHKQMYIQVIAKDNDYWPLPWYLRDFSQIGWWDTVKMDIPAADVIIVSPGMEEDLTFKLYESRSPGKRELYVPLLEKPLSLRPGVQLKVFVKLKTRDLLKL